MPAGGAVRTAMRMALALLLSCVPMRGQELPEGNSCIQCHRAIGDSRVTPPAQKFPEDIHLARGVLCQDCHGGDPTASDLQEAMDPAKRFIGKPDRQAIPQLCGRCHSNADYMKKFNPALRVDQVQEYFTSVHGKRLLSGDAKVATCISCHDVHRIRAVRDQQAWTYPVKVVETCGRCHGDTEYMQDYKIDTAVVAEYKASVHYEALTQQGDLSAPTCNRCHGNHGATPPEVDSVANVCGVCHSSTAEMFNRSPHQQAFAAMGLSPCVTCHGNHQILKTTDSMVGVNSEALCVNCHDAGSQGYQKAVQIRASLDQLRDAIGRAAAVVERAERAGMAVSEAKFELGGAAEALLKAQAAVHEFDPAVVRTFAEEGLQVAGRAHAGGLQALEDLRFRHRGLWISVGIILLAIAGLLLKIREIERRR